MKPTLEELTPGKDLREAMSRACQDTGGLEPLEERARNGGWEGLALLESPLWKSFAAAVTEAWRTSDHVVVRGLPLAKDGAALLLAALSLSPHFRTYRGGRVVKEFRMSPWTEDLSHTTRQGEFHTDLNTASEPPAVTSIQCLAPDPGTPRYGENRVARLRDLLTHLKSQGREDVLQFLHRADVTMTNGRDQSWSGRVFDGERLRYHPATLRAAAQSPAVAARLEEVLLAVHQAALAVSVPFHLGPGDAVFVSNRRAFHYRGECSVLFRRFPTEYEARAIFVLHQMSEPP